MDKKLISKNLEKLKLKFRSNSHREIDTASQASAYSHFSTVDDREVNRITFEILQKF